jgi:hypothetical protein
MVWYLVKQRDNLQIHEKFQTLDVLHNIRFVAVYENKTTFGAKTKEVTN